MSRPEAQSFLNIAPYYFQYIENALEEKVCVPNKCWLSLQQLEFRIIQLSYHSFNLAACEKSAINLTLSSTESFLQVLQMDGRYWTSKENCLI